MSTSSARKQLASTNKAISRTIGLSVTCMRPPYGATNASVTKASAQTQLRQVLWSIDTNDWKRSGVTSLTNQIAAAKDGDIVLMHDGGGDRTQTVTALAAALPKLVAKGYSFAAVPACLNN
jgi:peptidoglycan/xylan/chitin deacetylase (PgdA/CDA1 family)